MLIRNLGIAALFLLVIGIATQIPIPSMIMPPAQPSPAALPSQNQPAAAAPPSAPAESGDAPPGNPKRHAILQEVADAGEQVEAFPCSAKNRHRLAEAVTELGNFDRAHGGEPPTVKNVDGVGVPTGDPLGVPVHDVMNDALTDGVVHRTVSGVYEVPDPYAPVPPKSYISGRSARFMCEHPG
jgi:hypothetical protein